MLMGSHADITTDPPFPNLLNQDSLYHFITQITYGQSI